MPPRYFERRKSFNRSAGRRNSRNSCPSCLFPFGGGPRCAWAHRLPPWSRTPAGDNCAEVPAGRGSRASGRSSGFRDAAAQTRNPREVAEASSLAFRYRCLRTGLQNPPYTTHLTSTSDFRFRCTPRLEYATLRGANSLLSGGKPDDDSQRKEQTDAARATVRKAGCCR